MSEDGTSETNGAGRPKANINYDFVRGMARAQCTEAEIALSPELSDKGSMRPDSFSRRKKSDPELCQALQEGRADGLMSLRKAQFALADKGNATMQIWLGKQYLGQRDRTAIEHSGPEGGPIATGPAYDFSGLDETERRTLEALLVRCTSKPGP